MSPAIRSTRSHPKGNDYGITQHCPADYFAKWMEFNCDAVDQVGSQMIPDRRQTGDPSAVPDSFFANIGNREMVTFFLDASAGFMNLCDDLHTLATMTADADFTDEWNDIINFLTKVVTQDTFIDFAEPILGALFTQCSVAGAQSSATGDLAKDSSSLTCTVNVA